MPIKVLLLLEEELSSQRVLLSVPFEGDLIEDSREGKPEWVQIEDIPKIEMQENFRRRISLFFEEGMREEHIIKT